MSGTNACEYMNVIGRAVDDLRGSVHFADYAAEIGEQIVPGIRFNQREPALRGEKHVEQEIAGCVGHFLSPLRGLVLSLFPTHGLRRGLHSCAASRLTRRGFCSRARLSSASCGFESGGGRHTGAIVGRTKLVNLRNFQIGACNFSYSSAINNPPRAEVWQPVVVCLNLSCPSGI